MKTRERAHRPPISQSDLAVSRLGACGIDSPMRGLRFVDDREGVLLDASLEAARRRLGTSEPPAFELAGPRERIYFDPARTSTGIVTCGGLCPGLNDVVRAIVMSWHHHHRGGGLPAVEIVKIHRRRNFVRLGPGLIGFSGARVAFLGWRLPSHAGSIIGIRGGFHEP